MGSEVAGDPSGSKVVLSPREHRYPRRSKMSKLVRIFEVNGVTVYNQDTAMEAMESLGLDRVDTEDFVEYLQGNSGRSDLEYYEDALRDSEMAWDSLKSCIDEVLSLVEETQVGKMTKQTERLCGSISALINQYV